MLRLKYIRPNVVKYKKEKISDIKISCVDIGMTCQFVTKIHIYSADCFIYNFIPVLSCVEFFNFLNVYPGFKLSYLM